MVGSHIAHYQIRRQVGEGGMGVVYEATDERDGQRVAIKVMRAEFTRSREALTRFFNEARAANLVEHSAMVRIQEHGQIADGTAYLAMEFLQGDTLSARLKRYRGPMPEGEVRRIAWQLSSGLAAAHKKSIVHRDLKPANIMLVPDAANPQAPERVKILDFGIAKLDTVSLNLENPLTRTGAFMGTPHYMSPEQCKGVRNIDDRSDVYALGIILYQMLTGRLPFIAEGDGAVMAMHIYEAPPKPRSLVPAMSEPMQDLVLQMLSKDRESRPSALLVMKRLEELGAAEGLSSDMSVTFQEASATVPGDEASATLMRPVGAGSAARTMMMAGPASQPGSPSASHPSSPSISDQQSIPSTLGPVTGQLGTITRYSRPVLAGVAGACGLIAAVGLAVMLLRHPKPQQVQIRTAHSNHVTPPPEHSTPGSDAQPVLTADSKAPVPPTAPDADAPNTKPEVEQAPPHRTPAVARGKNRNKRHAPKRKPKGKSTPQSSSKTGVSVVD